MATNEKTFNVQEAMKEIQQEADDCFQQEVVPAFEEIPIREDPNARAVLPLEIEAAENLKFISYEWGFGAGVGAKIKQQIRKVIKCVVYPLLTNQNYFNEHVTQALRKVEILLRWQDEQAVGQKEREKALRNELIRVKETEDVHYRELTGTIQRLEKELAEARAEIKRLS